MLIALCAAAAAAAPPIISDLREGKNAKGQSLLSVKISSAEEPFAPTVWYREKESSPWLAAGLLRAGERFQAAIAAPKFTYYVEVYDSAATAPVRLGSAKEPLVFPTPHAAGQGLKLAVLELESGLTGADAKAVDRVYFGDKVRGALREALPGCTMMTRENVMQLLAASGKTLEQCEGTCAVETGKMLGADLVVSGRMSRIGKRYTLSLRLHRTADSTLLEDATASGKSLEAIDDETGKAVARLAAAVTRGP